MSIECGGKTRTDGQGRGGDSADDAVKGAGGGSADDAVKARRDHEVKRESGRAAPTHLGEAVRRCGCDDEGGPVRLVDDDVVCHAAHCRAGLAALRHFAREQFEKVVRERISAQRKELENIHGLERRLLRSRPRAVHLALALALACSSRRSALRAAAPALALVPRLDNRRRRRRRRRRRARRGVAAARAEHHRRRRFHHRARLAAEAERLQLQHAAQTAVREERLRGQGAPVVAPQRVSHRATICAVKRLEVSALDVAHRTAENVRGDSPGGARAPSLRHRCAALARRTAIRGVVVVVVQLGCSTEDATHLHARRCQCVGIERNQ